jgi:hypothetical protein
LVKPPERAACSLWVMKYSFRTKSGFGEVSGVAAKDETLLVLFFEDKFRSIFAPEPSCARLVFSFARSRTLCPGTMIPALRITFHDNLRGGYYPGASIQILRRKSILLIFQSKPGKFLNGIFKSRIVKARVRDILLRSESDYKNRSALVVRSRVRNGMGPISQDSFRIFGSTATEETNE